MIVHETSIMELEMGVTTGEWQNGDLQLKLLDPPVNGTGSRLLLAQKCQIRHHPHMVISVIH